MSKEIIGKRGTIRGTKITGIVERGRDRHKLPAGYKDGKARYLPAYVIICGIQVHPSKVDTDK